MAVQLAGISGALYSVVDPKASELLGIEPMLYMNMWLGEGSSAALAFRKLALKFNRKIEEKTEL